MYDGDGDVVPEHADVVLGQGQHLGKAVVVHAVRSPAQSQPHQMAGRVGIL